MARYTDHYNRLATPQSEPIPGTAQTKNEAGGYAWPVDDWERARRFLFLGAEDGTYYQSQREVTRESAQAVERCVKADGVRFLALIGEVAAGNRAPRMDPILFALAMAASIQGIGDQDTFRETRKLALEEPFHAIVRTQSHLTRFLFFLKALRGRGRAVRGAVRTWIARRDVDQLAYQWTKYRNRDGWTPRDVLRTFRPKPLTQPPHTDAIDGRADMYRWAAKGGPCEHPLVTAFQELQSDPTRAKAVRLIREHGLVREHVPTELLNHADVWEALAEKMPATALVRNLGKMTAVGLVAPLSEGERTVCAALDDHERLVKARVNPLAIFLAAETYAQGRGDKGKLSWDPSGRVLESLDGAFHGTFASVEPTGKRWCVAVDDSGSMSASRGFFGYAGMGRGLIGSPYRRALALVLARAERECVVLRFGTDCSALPISPRQRLDDVLRGHPPRSGSTDSSLPFGWALEAARRGGPVFDVFVTISDNQTWAGAIHPYQALQRYRRERNPRAALLGITVEPGGHSLYSPDDALCAAAEGFDASLLEVARDLALRGS